jgi:hypothetical protein
LSSAPPCLGLVPILVEQRPLNREAPEPKVIVTDRALFEQRVSGGQRSLTFFASLSGQPDEAIDGGAYEAGPDLLDDPPSRPSHRQGLSLLAPGQGDFRALDQNHGFVASRVDRPRPLQPVRLEFRRVRVAAGQRQRIPERLCGEHLRVTVTDPDRNLEPQAHVAQGGVDCAGIHLAMPHHDAVCRSDARKPLGVAESDAIGEMAQRRRHAAVQVLGVGETAERASLPFRRIDPPRRLERAFVFAATGRQLASREMEVAAKIVNLGQRAIVEACGGERLRLGQRRKGVVKARDEAIGGRPADEPASPVRRCAAHRQRAVIGLERFLAASCVLLQISELRARSTTSRFSTASSRPASRGRLPDRTGRALEEQRIAAGPLHALRRKCVGVDESPRDRQGVGWS